MITIMDAEWNLMSYLNDKHVPTSISLLSAHAIEDALIPPWGDKIFVDPSIHYQGNWSSARLLQKSRGIPSGWRLKQIMVNSPFAAFSPPPLRRSSSGAFCVLTTSASTALAKNFVSILTYGLVVHNFRPVIILSHRYVPTTIALSVHENKDNCAAILTGTASGGNGHIFIYLSFISVEYEF